MDKAYMKSKQGLRDEKQPAGQKYEGEEMKK